MPPSEHRYVSTAQVAQALGVSVTTVKRWVDDGVLPAHRTAGGHRKLVMEDVVRLVREGNLPQADLSLLVPGKSAGPLDPAVLYAQVQAAVRAEDTDLIRTIIHAGYRAGIPVETLADRVLGPVLAELGHDWQAGRATVMTEHRVTQACVSTLYEMRSFLRVRDGKDRPTAVGGAPEHDPYILPTLLAKLTLLDCGWEAINLGPHTPVEAFETAIEQFAPRLIWLSVSQVANTEQFLTDYRRLYEQCVERNIPVAIGGQGLQSALRTRMTYTMFGDGFTQLAAFARSLHHRPGLPKRGRPPGSAKDAVEPG
jgi:excisionase family DNA binding protein